MEETNFIIPPPHPKVLWKVFSGDWGPPKHSERWFITNCSLVKIILSPPIFLWKVLLVLNLFPRKDFSLRIVIFSAIERYKITNIYSILYYNKWNNRKINLNMFTYSIYDYTNNVNNIKRRGERHQKLYHSHSF